MKGSKAARKREWNEALLWLAKARDDLAAGRVLLAAELLDPAAFHVQQALEKGLKALLAAAGEPLRKTHDIGQLAGFANAHWPDIIELPFRLTGVGQWYVGSRYPGTQEQGPDAAEIVAALEAVADLLNLAASGAAPPNV